MNDKCPNCGFTVTLSPRERNRLAAELHAAKESCSVLEDKWLDTSATLSKTSAEVINLTVDNQRLQLEVERLTALLQSTSHATGCPAWGVRWRDGAWEHDNRPCTCHKEQINATTKDRLHPGKHLPAREAPQHPEEARSQKGDDLQ